MKCGRSLESLPVPNQRHDRPSPPLSPLTADSPNTSQTCRQNVYVGSPWPAPVAARTPDAAGGARVTRARAVCVRVGGRDARDSAGGRSGQMRPVPGPHVLHRASRRLEARAQPRDARARARRGRSAAPQAVVAAALPFAARTSGGWGAPTAEPRLTRI